MLQLFLLQGILTDVLLGLQDCLFLLLLCLCDVVFLLLLLPLPEDELALLDLPVPEFLNVLKLSWLCLVQVWWNLVQEESTVILVTVCHVLLVVRVLVVLEFEVGDSTSCKVEGDTWLV